MNTKSLQTTLAAGALLALSACGGADGLGPTARGDGTPVLATLSEGGGESGRLRNRDLQAARAGLEAALAGDPSRVADLNNLAVSYYLEGRFDAARELLDEVVARGGPAEQQAALLNLGELYALDGYISAAQAHLESARGIDPARPEPVYALALLADTRGDPVAASLAREALALDTGGGARANLVFVYPEERQHLEALLADAGGDVERATAHWYELRQGRFAALAATAARHLGGR